MGSNRTQVLLQKSLFIVAALIVITQVIDQSEWTSRLFLLTFPLTVILWLQSIQRKLYKGDLLIIGISLLALVNVLLNVIVTNTAVQFSYFNKVIMFIMSLLFLQTAGRVQIDQDTVRFFRRTVDLLVVFLVLMFIVGGRQMYTIEGIYVRYLTFRFDNPNMTGLLLTCLFIMEFSELYSRRGLLSKLVHLSLAVVLFAFILLTESRNAMIVAVLFALVVLWLLWKHPEKLTISKAAAAVVCVFPLVFAIVYTEVIFDEKLQNALDFLVDVGKHLDSRVGVWNRAWELTGQSPIIGAYSQASNGTGSTQLHNTHMDIMASYGIPVLVLVCVFMYMLIRARGKRYADKESYVYMLGFICTTTLGMGEAALFSGGLGIYIFMGVLLLLSNQAREEQELSA